MKRYRASSALILTALMLGFAALACGQFGPSQPTPVADWTPVPLTMAPPSSSNTPSPTVEVGGSNTQGLATPGIPTAGPVQEATGDPHLIVITENDIAGAIAGGATGQQGLGVENLNVRFAAGKTQITSSRVSYSMISIENLTIIGRLVAQDGTLQLETESVSPQGLVSGMIPGLINQALKQYTSQWYVEDVKTLDGRIEVRIR